jgi:hypothetical protein
MRAFLDDQSLTTDRPTLAAALRAAAQQAQRQGRVVVEVTIDGQPAGDELLDHPPDEPTAAEVRLVSIDPRQLVRETLGDCVEALSAANDDQLGAAELIQTARMDEALEPLGCAMGTWQAVRDALERSLALLRSEAVQVDPRMDAAQIEALVSGLAVRLEEIRAALSREDWSALADVLAYDMPGEVEHWKLALAELAKRLE